MKRVFLAFLIITSFALVSCDRNGTEENENTQISDLATDIYTVITLAAPDELIYDESIFQNHLYYIYYQGITTYSHPIDNRQAMIRKIDITDHAVIFDIPLAIPAEQTIQLMDIDEDGNIYVLTRQVDERWECLDIYLYQFTPDGEIARAKSILPAFVEFDNYTPLDFIIDDDGNGYILSYVSSGNEFRAVILVIDPDGDLLFYVDDIRYVGFLFQDTKGQVYLYASENRGHIRYMAAIDLHTQGLGEITDITAHGMMTDNFGNVSSHISSLSYLENKNLFTANRGGVYEHNMEDETLKTWFTWRSLDVAFDETGRAYPLLGNQVLWADRPHGGGDPGYPKHITYYLVRPATAEEIATAEERKREIEEQGDNSNMTFGYLGWYMSKPILEAVMTFNRTNPSGSRIEIKQYGSSFTDITEPGLLELQLDIASGKCPDILFLPPDLSYGLFAQQGVFENLYPYMEADDSFDWMDYQENIIRAYEIDEQLFALPIVYHIEGMIGSATVLDGFSDWDMDGIEAFANRFPDSQIFYQPTQMGVLDICLKANTRHIADWSSGESTFNRSLLIKILEFAHRYTSDSRYSDNRSMEERVAEGDLLLAQGMIPMDNTYWLDLFGEQVSYIGFPTESNNDTAVINAAGFIINSYNVVAVSSQSRNKDAAWQFISSLLTKEIQSDGNMNGYPLLKSSMNESITLMRERYALLPEFIDITLLDENVNMFREINDNAYQIRLFDRQIDDIIKEEAGAYFSGQKSVEDVVAIIENRVGIYVKEAR